MAAPSAFVIMAFREPLNNIYHSIVAPILKENGFAAIRADEITGSKEIIQQIEDSIAGSEIIVADVTGNNPNVYLELGIARSLRKDIILLAQDAKDLPSDTRSIRHLIYNPTELDRLRQQFEVWIRNSRSFVLKSEKEIPKVMSRGDIFTHITDATFYLHHEIRDAKSEILSCIHNRRLIPPSFLYRFDRGASLWLELCQDPTYHYFSKSVQFFGTHADAILDAIGDEVVTKSPDLISLGPGNGYKDRILLSKLVERQKSPQCEMYYYPYDINPNMISSAIGAVTTSEKLKENLKVKAVVADFNYLKSFSPVYQFRTEPNIFLLLGNTLGNMDHETNFLEQIQEAMFAGDILVVEVRSHSAFEKDKDIGGSLTKNRLFDFTPLDSLGVFYEEEKLTYRVAEDRSQIPKSKTTIASYRDFSIPGESDRIKSASLSYIHVYDQAELVRVMEGLGFKILNTFFPRLVSRVLC